MKAVYSLEDLRDWRDPDLCYAVVGDPVAHSASPAMHNAVLEQLGLPDRYCRLQILPEGLREAIQMLPKAGFKGVNLTIPHKTQVLSLVTEIDEHSRRLGAVNTIAFRNGNIIGRNTDGPGIVRAIAEEFGVALGTQRVMVLGAGGGAGRAISTQCYVEGCPELILVNRTGEKILELSGELHAKAIPWTEAALGNALNDVDLIINASSLGMKPGEKSPIPSSLLKPGHLVFDTVYAGRTTPLQSAAAMAGARTTNGLSLLLHQGVLALEFWLGQAVPVGIMRAGLQNFINAED